MERGSIRFFGKQFENNGEKRRIWRTRNLSPSAYYKEINVHYEDSDKGTVFGEYFTDRPSIDILYYPEERDDKGELKKLGITCYLGQQHCCVNLKMKRFIL